MKYTIAHNVPGRLALLLVLLSAVLLAPARGLEAAARAAQVVVDYDLYERDVIEIKFREGLRVRLRNGVPTDLSGQALDNPQALAALDTVSDGRWTRSHRLDEATLDRMRVEGMARAERALPDLNHWFRLELPPGMEAAEAI